MDSEGSRLLILEAVQAGADAVKGRVFSEAEREAKRENAHRLQLDCY